MLSRPCDEQLCQKGQIGKHSSNLLLFVDKEWLLGLLMTLGQLCEKTAFEKHCIFVGMG